MTASRGRVELFPPSGSTFTNTMLKSLLFADGACCAAEQPDALAGHVISVFAIIAIRPVVSVENRTAKVRSARAAPGSAKLRSDPTNSATAVHRISVALSEPARLGSLSRTQPPRAAKLLGNSRFPSTDPPAAWRHRVSRRPAAGQPRPDDASPPTLPWSQLPGRSKSAPRNRRGPTAEQAVTVQPPHSSRSQRVPRSLTANQSTDAPARAGPCQWERMPCQASRECTRAPPGSSRPDPSHRQQRCRRACFFCASISHDRRDFAPPWTNTGSQPRRSGRLHRRALRRCRPGGLLSAGCGCVELPQRSPSASRDLRCP
jgi:hypothetical protein